MRPRPIDNPPNPWASTSLEYLDEIPLAKVELFEDHSKEILSRNDSPELPFAFGLNPYRGCHHACAYCYARQYHEYLSFGAGTDFDTKIVVKRRAAELLRARFERPSWKGERVMFSGATDCYQPIEASLQLTRACLEVCARYRNPVGIVTKAPLIERDLDLLSSLTREAAVQVSVSIPIWDEAMARALEPGVANPHRRIRTIERLAGAGISVGLLVAPLIPGVSEQGMGELLETARAAGANSVHWSLLRLPGPVKQVFEQRLRVALPLRAERVLHRMSEIHGRTGNGSGGYAEALGATLEALVKRLEFPGSPGEASGTFRRPAKGSAQLSLFDG